MLIVLAIVAVLLAMGRTEIYRCPRHSDGFDVLLCDLCSIRMFRQSEIDEFVSRFEAGHVPRFK